ncbi:MAG: cyclodeaminase/cyclohydrolase family protein [Vulcanimicrobiaceae bacterium]
MERIDEYLQALASEAPIPGGGSAATIVAAHGAALVAMVARICAANPKRASTHALAERLVHDADQARADLLAARALDESAFSLVVAAQALPRDTDDAKTTRTAALQASLAGAAYAPLQAARLAMAVMMLARDALALENEHLLSDLGCAAEFASSAVRACAYNVRINHRYLRNATLVAEQRDELIEIEQRRVNVLADVRTAIDAL